MKIIVGTKTQKEYEALREECANKTGEEFWDFPVNELFNGAIEPRDDVAYVGFVDDEGEVRLGELPLEFWEEE